MKRVMTFLMLVGALTFVSSAVAQDSDEAKQCPASGAEGAVCPAGQTADADASCCAATEAILAKLPQMTFQVGEENTCCSDSAAAMAKKAELPVKFVVAEKTYDDKAAAFTALVETTEEFVSSFAKPHTCDKSGATSVAGKEVGCSHEQVALESLVNSTMENVKMTYVVGDKDCECPNQAKALAKGSDAKTEFVVNGEKTSCNLTARLNLAQAKYVAVVNAMAKRAEEPSSGHGDTEEASDDS